MPSLKNIAALPPTTRIRGKLTAMNDDNKQDERFARFVVRPGCRGALLGINHGLLREGVVYEVVELLGEIVLREVGPSPLGLPAEESIRRFAFSNDNRVDDLLQHAGTGIVLTTEELERARPVLPRDG